MQVKFNMSIEIEGERTDLPSITVDGEGLLVADVIKVARDAGGLFADEVQRFIKRRWNFTWKSIVTGADSDGNLEYRPATDEEQADPTVVDGAVPDNLTRRGRV
jgi:hypothetical protein